MAAAPRGPAKCSQLCTEFNTQHLVLEHTPSHPSIWEEGAGSARSSRSSLVTKQVPGQLGLHEILSQTQAIKHTGTQMQ